MWKWMLLLGAALAVPAAARGADWQADPAASSLEFSGAAEGEAFTGRFKQFTPLIRFDPADLGGSRFEVDIDLASADTQNAERDETLRGSDFFSVARFPRASYLATAFRDLGGGRYAADGTLTLRGIAKPVTLEFTWSAQGEGATLEGKATVQRLDFDVGAGDWADDSTVAHAIGVSTRLTLRAR